MSGVRNLDREMMSLARKAVTELQKQVVEGRDDADRDDAGEGRVLPPGLPRFRHGEAEREDQVGSYTDWRGPRSGAS